MVEELCKEFARLFLDVAKYIITGVLLTTLFGDYNNKTMVYALCFAIIAACSIMSACLFYIADNQKQNNHEPK